MDVLTPGGDISSGPRTGLAMPFGESVSGEPTSERLAKLLLEIPLMKSVEVGDMDSSGVLFPDLVEEVPNAPTLEQWGSRAVKKAGGGDDLLMWA